MATKKASGATPGPRESTLTDSNDRAAKSSSTPQPSKSSSRGPTDANDRARRTAADGSERTGVDIPDADRDILSQPIDKRMKALLEDHRRMGARP